MNLRPTYSRWVLSTPRNRVQWNSGFTFHLTVRPNGQIHNSTLGPGQRAAACPEFGTTITLARHLCEGCLRMTGLCYSMDKRQLLPGIIQRGCRDVFVSVKVKQICSCKRMKGYWIYRHAYQHLRAWDQCIDLTPILKEGLSIGPLISRISITHT